MKFEVTPAGKKELSGPETWAKNPNTVKLVTRLLKGGVDTDSISDKERGRLNRWVNLWIFETFGRREDHRHEAYENLSQSCLADNFNGAEDCANSQNRP
jgi:hypothetical protein